MLVRCFYILKAMAGDPDVDLTLLFGETAASKPIPDTAKVTLGDVVGRGGAATCYITILILVRKVSFARKGPILLRLCAAY